MLILGNDYHFNQYELKKLHKKFKSIEVEYLTSDPVEQIKQVIAQQDCIVLNVELDEAQKQAIALLDQQNKIITLAEFMQKYLEKVYVPLDKTIAIAEIENLKPLTTVQYIQKRVIDYIGIFCLFVISWPIMLYSRFKIKKESPGSVIYRQNRVGINNQIFKCNKFRSMHENSYYNPYTSKEDPRVFPYGQIMRKTRIDEIPQMFNVLKNEMHLIGPRAEWDVLVENYEKEIPFYNKRHIVRPGITGWAQVNYPYGENAEDARQKLMYDLYYIKHWSLWLEMKVVYKTILVVLGRKGL